MCADMCVDFQWGGFVTVLILTQKRGGEGGTGQKNFGKIFYQQNALTLNIPMGVL